ncbi:hypothetical protein [Enterovirga sp. CN4-39]|uniref:hypothetical protein n=1 Tax=Enterovirga sp. CN4-39 TaxID=3400910 RepID=UPI003C029877
MKRPAIVLTACLLSGSLASGQSVPFGEPRAKADRLSQPSLGDLMTFVQFRHIKLWIAGKARNWEALAYEAGQLQDSLARSALLYSNIPIELVLAMNKPLKDIGQAAKERNAALFQAGYRDLQAGCNACHQAAGIGFIRIQTPTSSPFTDQALGSGGKAR